jgi:nucleoside phosphorylase
MGQAAARPIAIVTPMHSEMAPFLEPLALQPAEARGDWAVFDGRWHGLGVVAAVSGCGMVNCAAATAMLLARSAPQIALHSGCCGAHAEDLLPGDLVIGRRAVTLGQGRLDADGLVGGAGGVFLDQLDSEFRDGIYLTAPQAWVTAAREAFRQRPALREPWSLPASWPKAAPSRPARCRAGVLGSWDCWTTDAKHIRALRDRYGQDGEDCESAAFMQVAARFAVRALAIRGVCNNDLHLPLALGDADLTEAMAEAARRAARLVLATLERLPR